MSRAQLRTHALVATLLLATIGGGPLRAQEPEAVRVTDGGVLVDFQDADLRLVISALAEAGGLNVAYAELPARRVTLRMQQPVPKADILPLLRSLAQSNGLRVTEEGTFVRLEPAGTGPATATKDTTAGPAEETRLYVYRLKHVRAAKLAGTLQALFTGSAAAGAAHAGTRPASLSESLRESQGAFFRPDSAPRVTVNVGPKPGGLPGQLRGDIQIVADETTNALLVRAGPSDWEVVRETVEALDLRPLQVLIEVVIAEVRRSSERDLSLSAVVTDQKGNPSVRGTLKGQTTGDVLLEVLRMGNLDLAGTLSILSARGDVRIISRPVVVAQNNQEARILIGSERPFVQVSRSLPTDGAIRDQVIQYRDVGTKLTITPTINADGYVNLQVLQEVSTATAETQFGAPIISTREAATFLFIKNGRTAVLGGLIDRQQERTRTGIPVLMDIPLLGSVFGTSHKSVANSELFLFLTPHIIADDEASDRVREDLQRRAPALDKALQEEHAIPSVATPPSASESPLRP
jgi:general secretion pathway protein D